MASPAAAPLKFLVPEEMNPPMNVTLVNSVDGLAKVQDFFNRNSVFGLDTETNMVDTYHERKMRTIQVGSREEQYVIDLLPFWATDTTSAVLTTFQPVLESTSWLKVGHNLEFEYIMFLKDFGIRAYNFYDTNLAEKIIWAGAVDFFTPGFYSLKQLVERRLGLAISKDAQTTFNLTDPLTAEQIIYGALDTRLPLGIKASQYGELVKHQLLPTAQIEFDAIPASGEIQWNGMKLDTQKWLELQNQNATKKAEIIAKLDEHFVPLVGRKRTPDADMDALEKQWRAAADKTQRAEFRKQYMNAQKANTEWKRNSQAWEGEAAINYSSSAQLKSALRSLGYDKNKLPDTNDQTLKKLRGEPVIDLLREYRKYDKLITTYGEEFITNHVSPFTGRIHQRFIQLGAATGRSASSAPNMQNLPGIKAYRECFIAEAGYKLITLDYNGCELRILTEYSQEPVWIRAFLDGWDVHSLGASLLYGKKWTDHEHDGCLWKQKHEKCSCPEHEKLRKRVKAINFGLAYGMSARRLSEELEIPLNEAEALLKAYCAAFPALVKYLEVSGKKASSKLESRTLAQRRRLFHKPTWEQAKKSAKRKLELRKMADTEPNAKQISSAYSGMFASIEREGKNSPIQGTNADMIKLAKGCGKDSTGKPFLWHYLALYGAKLISSVHDELIIEAPDDVCEKVKEIAADCMVRAGQQFVKSIPTVAEGKIAPHWSK